jgi:hypothetical protein
MKRQGEPIDREETRVKLEADFSVLDPSLIVNILSYHLFPFNRFTYCLFRSTGSDLVILKNLFGYFKREPVRTVRKLYTSLDVKRSYKHYWAIVQYKQSINPFRGSVYVDLLDNEQFSDNLLLLSFGTGSENLRHLNLQNTFVSSQGLIQLFSRAFPNMRFIDVENAGVNCDIATAIDAGMFQNMQNLRALKFSPPVAPTNDLSPPKKKKKQEKSNYVEILAKQCTNLQCAKLGSAITQDCIDLFKLTSLVEIDLTKPIIGKAHVDLLEKLTNLRIAKITEAQWEKGFSDKQFGRWCSRLEHLTLSKCKLKDADIEPILDDKSQLISLDLSYNDSVVGKIFSKFDQCKNLVSVNVSHSKKVSGKNLENLLSSNITHLDLSNCELKDNKIKAFLAKLPDSLTSLNLANNDLSDDSMDKLITNKSLREVDLSGNINLYEVEKLASLESVTIRNVTSGKANRDDIEKGVNELLKSTTLRTLIASGNKIKKVEKPNASITKLDLSENEITNRFAHELFQDILDKKEKHQLSWLSLASNRISYDGVSALQTINETLDQDTCNLRYLDVSNNPCATDNAIMEHAILDKVSSQFYDLVMEFLETQDGYDSGHDSDFEFDNKEENDDDHHIEDDDD